MFVPPSSCCAGGTSSKDLTGPALGKAEPCASDHRQGLYGMRLCIFLSQEGFCLKRLRAWSIKTFLNPAISSTMLSCVGLYQPQCHQHSLTDTVQNQLLTELQVTFFSQLMVSPFLTCTCAKSHWSVLDTMFLLTVGPGLSLSYGMITSDSFSFPCWVQMLHRNLIYTKSTLECTY